ncbi:MAG: hypothetical protein R2727_04705 [Bacteroidales bacterium]
MAVLTGPGDLAVKYLSDSRLCDPALAVIAASGDFHLTGIF